MAQNLKPDLSQECTMTDLSESLQNEGISNK